MPLRTSSAKRWAPTERAARRSCRPSGVSASAARRALTTASSPTPAPATTQKPLIVGAPAEACPSRAQRARRTVSWGESSGGAPLLAAPLPPGLLHVPATLLAGPTYLAAHLEPDLVARLRRERTSNTVAQ